MMNKDKIKRKVQSIERIVGTLNLRNGDMINKTWRNIDN